MDFPTNGSGPTGQGGAAKDESLYSQISKEQPQQSTPTAPFKQVSGRFYRIKPGAIKLPRSGLVVSPAATPRERILFARETARETFRSKWQLPPDHVRRSPEEHRRALAALESIETAGNYIDVYAPITLHCLAKGRSKVEG